MTLLLNTAEANSEEAADSFAQGADAFLSTEKAQIALWWRETPPLNNLRTACIGSFEAQSEASATMILHEAFRILKEKGIEVAIGPMNGNTWRAHRFVSKTTNQPPFFLEPRNHPDYPSYFIKAGFEPLSNYSSNLIDLTSIQAKLENTRKRLHSNGITIRELHLENFESDLECIFEICLECFQSNFLYTPLSKEHFMGMYTKIKPFTDPQYVLLAEYNSKPIGFVFAIPDLETQQAGHPPALIVKTLAVLPEKQFAGLGSVLVDQVQQRALANGYIAAIHALQHENNTSLRISKRFNAKKFRQYTLYSKML